MDGQQNVEQNAGGGRGGGGGDGGGGGRGRGRGIRRPCSFCRHQRRRCPNDCHMRPYFPPERYEDYMVAYRLFGTVNIQRFMASVDLPHLKREMAESLMTEAHMRRLDRVHGGYGFVRNLADQIEQREHELALVNRELVIQQENERQRRNMLMQMSQNRQEPFIPTLFPSTQQQCSGTGGHAELRLFDEGPSSLGMGGRLSGPGETSGARNQEPNQEEGEEEEPQEEEEEEDDE